MDTRSSQPLKGATQVYCPPHHDVCHLFNHSLRFTKCASFLGQSLPCLFQFASNGLLGIQLAKRTCFMKTEHS